MIPLTPAFLINTASSYAGQGDDAHGTSRGRFVDAVLRMVELVASTPAQRAQQAQLAQQAPKRRAYWDTAFVHYAGFWSHYDVRRGNSTWPLPPVADPVALYEYAASADALAAEPEPGDVFIVVTPRKFRPIRSGVVVAVEDRRPHSHYGPAYECITIEGDTNSCMELGGGQVLRHRRVLTPRIDPIIRWVLLKKQAIIPEAA